MTRDRLFGNLFCFRALTTSIVIHVWFSCAYDAYIVLLACSLLLKEFSFVVVHDVTSREFVVDKYTEGYICSFVFLHFAPTTSCIFCVLFFSHACLLAQMLARLSLLFILSILFPTCRIFAEHCSVSTYVGNPVVESPNRFPLSYLNSFLCFECVRVSVHLLVLVCGRQFEHFLVRIPFLRSFHIAN